MRICAAGSGSGIASPSANSSSRSRHRATAKAREAALGEHVAFLRSYSVFLARLDHAEEAIKLVTKAVELDPLNATTLSDQAWVLFMARRYPQAIDVGRKTLVSAPEQNQAHYVIGASFLLMGQREKAKVEMAKLPDDNLTRLSIGAIIALKDGDLNAADKALARLQELSHDAFNFQYAEVYAQRGDPGLATAALERALVARDPGLLALRVSPFLDPVRHDPRFVALEAKLDFPA